METHHRVHTGRGALPGGNCPPPAITLPTHPPPSVCIGSGPTSSHHPFPSAPALRREALLLWPLSSALQRLLGHGQAPADARGCALPLPSVRSRLLQPGLHAGAHAQPLAQPAAARMDHPLHFPLLFLPETAPGLDLSRESVFHLSLMGCVLVFQVSFSLGQECN